MKIFQIAFTLTFVSILIGVIGTVLLRNPYNLSAALWAFATLCLLYFAVRDDE